MKEHLINAWEYLLVIWYFIAGNWGVLLAIFIATLAWKAYRYFVPASKTKAFPIHLGTSLFTLAIIVTFWELVYHIIFAMIETYASSWLVMLPWYINLIPIAMSLHSMWFFCRIEPSAPSTNRAHLLFGKAREVFESSSGQMSFWIGKPLKGALGSHYVNNIPDPNKKQVSKLYGNSDDGTDKDGAIIELAGGFRPGTTDPDPSKWEAGIIKASMDWRIIDIVALINQIIDELPEGEAEILWNDDLKKKAEKLFVSLHLFPEIRNVCGATSYRDINKAKIQDSINDHVRNSNPPREAVNVECAAIGVEIKVVTVSEVRATNPDTIQDLSKAARESVQKDRERDNLQTVQETLKTTIQMLDDIGFASDKDAEARKAAIAKEALVIVKANNGLQKQFGTALEELLERLTSGKVTS